MGDTEEDLGEVKDLVSKWEWYFCLSYLEDYGIVTSFCVGSELLRGDRAVSNWRHGGFAGSIGSCIDEGGYSDESKDAWDSTE
jgi:hypothetical protein